MDSVKAISCLHFEFKIMAARNIKVTDSKGYMFIRYFLPAGNNRRVRLDSHKIAPNGNVSWNKSFSLDCVGIMQSMDKMIQEEKIAFELRWRSSTISMVKTIIGGNGILGGSQLLGRAEMPWKSIFESPNMEVERWLVMTSKKHAVKAPSIHLYMKIQVNPSEVVMKESRTKNADVLKNNWDESCGCSHGHCCQTSCTASELVAIGFALDAF
ncbi:C2 calcium/lipid-binding domain, CaLB [Artemisia annua]|uniref:C2 calcium/lipid-binding domain, CaLB n=1 Tax=Artemisia annua TaxID=35608 RepID=A0A2U1PJ83_ARTAN|nr:C2 calcium/lipid-binding domain, CaLB [Artemisia annua]